MVVVVVCSVVVDPFWSVVVVVVSVLVVPSSVVVVVSVFEENEQPTVPRARTPTRPAATMSFVLGMRIIVPLYWNTNLFSFNHKRCIEVIVLDKNLGTAWPNRA